MIPSAASNRNGIANQAARMRRAPLKGPRNLSIAFVNHNKLPGTTWGPRVGYAPNVESERPPPRSHGRGPERKMRPNFLAHLRSILGQKALVFQ